ncbi:MAG TPA: valine--tRNA ligase [Clostridiales bacterium UBA8153]|nr:valine--tRNA ligase [Clostridiales bacterium UBA8153]
MSLNQLPKAYGPGRIEEQWYGHWLGQDSFRAEAAPGQTPFAIVIPPPNVTGSLHIGHALNNTLQDIIIRRRRMQGYATLWLPGTDHASIATHIKIEEALAKEGLTRHDLGRERFMERAWAWKARYGGTIVSQLKRLGCSCDWSRERFTMDEGCSQAVLEVFVRLYRKGLIYRGDYMTNWCPTCRTVISDLEVDHEDTAGHLYHVRYPLVTGEGYVTVATTRPETILGDTAVAVHPGDPRYAGLVGRVVILPVLKRELPIIADSYVDSTFGTGAVKVTPGHDPNDFDMGARHGLLAIQVIGQDGRMTAAAGPYAGLDRYECRKKLVAELANLGLLVKTEGHRHALGHCQRCSSVVEPLVSRQWFVKMQPLARPAVEAVKAGEVRFIPERFTKVYLNWMENVRDWCISRQLWWGHRIPAWYCRACGTVQVATAAPGGHCSCGEHGWEQDPDVLDTWFSSALWPFSTLGWPEDTGDLRTFYPTQVLVTNYDIIFFWVARMVFMALEFTGQVPFDEVLIHGTVRNAQGQRMSKSLGTGVDPLEVIDKYGADALRFSLVMGNALGNDLRFSWEKVEGARNFANKLWNAARFVRMNLEGFEPPGTAPELGTWDRWILGRLDRVVDVVNRALDEYAMDEAAQALYDFVWSELCDWYLEVSKLALAQGAGREAVQYTLWRTMETTMRLLHPFMPFLTEEVWQALPHSGTSVMLASWPVPVGQTHEDENATVQLAMAAIRAIRNLRAEFGVPPGQAAEVLIRPVGNTQPSWEALVPVIARLAQAFPVRVEEDAPVPPQSATAVVEGASIYLPLAGLIDFDRERQRLERELALMQKELEKTASRLDDAGFRARAPRDIVEKEEGKRLQYQERLERLRKTRSLISGGNTS